MTDLDVRPFYTTNEKGWPKCSYCGWTIQSENVTRQRMHLAGTGKNAAHCPSVPLPLKLQLQALRKYDFVPVQPGFKRLPLDPTKIHHEFYAEGVLHDNKTRVQCLFCDTTISHAIGRMKAHLYEGSKDVLVCPKRPESVRELMEHTGRHKDDYYDGILRKFCKADPGFAGQAFKRTSFIDLIKDLTKGAILAHYKVPPFESICFSPYPDAEGGPAHKKHHGSSD